MRRLGLVVAAVLLAIVVAVGALLALGGRDEAPVAPASGPGEPQPDRGAEHLSGDRRAAPSPAGRPAASGPHRPELVTRDRRELTEDQILHALELGDVVIFYPQARPPAALAELQRELAAGFDAELAAAGQAVILARRPGIGAVTAVAWRSVLTAGDPADPRLLAFAEYWLGRGAG